MVAVFFAVVAFLVVAVFFAVVAFLVVAVFFVVAAFLVAVFLVVTFLVAVAFRLVPIFLVVVVFRFAFVGGVQGRPRSSTICPQSFASSRRSVEFIQTPVLSQSSRTSGERPRGHVDSSWGSPRCPVFRLRAAPSSK